MIQATLTEAKSKLSELLKRVEAGDTVLIVRRGRAIARIVPPGPLDEPEDVRLAALERQGLLRRPLAAPNPAIFDKKPPGIPASASLLSALLDERERER